MKDKNRIISSISLLGKRFLLFSVSLNSYLSNLLSYSKSREYQFKLEGRKVIQNPAEVTDYDFGLTSVCLNVLFPERRNREGRSRWSGRLWDGYLCAVEA